MNMTILFISIVIIIFILLIMSFMKKNSKTEDKKMCDSNSRNVSACTMEYNPVCGWNNKNIKCIRYPCASTYSNPCVACKNEDVEYYTLGECPKS